MLCMLILYMSSGTYSLKSTPNVKFWRNCSRQLNFLSEFLPGICWEEVAEQIFFYISFHWRYLDWGLNRGTLSTRLRQWQLCLAYLKYLHQFRFFQILLIPDCFEYFLGQSSFTMVFVFWTLISRSIPYVRKMSSFI